MTTWWEIVEKFKPEPIALAPMQETVVGTVPVNSELSRAKPTFLPVPHNCCEDPTTHFRHLNGAQVLGPVPALREQREEIVAPHQRRMALPPIPDGVRLACWDPKQPPVVLQQCSVVIDVEKFVLATLEQLQARIEGKDFLAGNWSLRELIERLEQVGVKVEVTR